MSGSDSLPAPLPVRTYIEDGAYVAAILLVWGVLSLFSSYVLSEIGGPGSLFEMLGPWLGDILLQVGLLNAALFAIYRATDYWQA